MAGGFGGDRLVFEYEDWLVVVVRRVVFRYSR